MLPLEVEGWLKNIQALAKMKFNSFMENQELDGKSLSQVWQANTIS